MSSATLEISPYTTQSPKDLYTELSALSSSKGLYDRFSLEQPDPHAGKFSGIVERVMQVAPPENERSRRKKRPRLAARIKRLQKRFPESSNKALVDEFERWLQQKQQETLSEFVKRVQSQEEAGDLYGALDVLYTRIDDLLLAGQFREIDALLAGLEVTNVSLHMLVGLLTTTLPAKTELEARSQFFVNSRATLQKRGENTDGLLAGLE